MKFLSGEMLITGLGLAELSEGSALCLAVSIASGGVRGQWAGAWGRVSAASLLVFGTAGAGQPARWCLGRQA